MREAVAEKFPLFPLSPLPPLNQPQCFFPYVNNIGRLNIFQISFVMNWGSFELHMIFYSTLLNFENTKEDRSPINHDYEFFVSFSLIPPYFSPKMSLFISGQNILPKVNNIICLCIIDVYLIDHWLLFLASSCLFFVLFPSLS